MLLNDATVTLDSNVEEANVSSYFLIVLNYDDEVDLCKKRIFSPYHTTHYLDIPFL
jgi:hypothetical protein